MRFHEYELYTKQANVKTMLNVFIDLPSSSAAVIRVASSVHATSVTWSQDGIFIFVSLGNGSISIVDSRSSTLVGCLNGHKRACYGTAFINPTTLMSWSSDGKINKWDVQQVLGICSDPLVSCNLSNFSVFGCCKVSNNADGPKSDMIVVGCSVFDSSILDKSVPEQQCYFIGNVHAVQI